MSTRYNTLSADEARRRRDADEAAALALEDPNAPIPERMEKTMPKGNKSHKAVTHPCPGGCGCKVPNPEYYCAACANFRKRAGPGKPKGSTLPGEAARAAPPDTLVDPLEGLVVPVVTNRVCLNPTNNPNCKGTVGPKNKTGLCISCAMKAVRAKKKPTPPATRGRRGGRPMRYVCANPDNNPNCSEVTTRNGGLCRSCGIRAGKKRAARAKHKLDAPHTRVPAARQRRPLAEPPRPSATAPPAEPAPPVTAAADALVPVADPLATRDVVLGAVERVVHGFPQGGELEVRVRITQGHMSLKADLQLP